MARKAKPKSAFEIARSTPSAVARAAFLRSGAGKHGKSGRDKNRAERQQAKRDLRGGDF